MLQSPVDIAIVAGVILLIFGPKKVPELGKALGQGIGNFKRALFEAQDEVKTALKEDPATSRPNAPPPQPVQLNTVSASAPVPAAVGMDITPAESKPPQTTQTT
jgi:sec-independent protein translocase protein TatA